MDRKIIRTKDAPEAIGPYSQGVIAGDLVFCSGQIPLDPTTGAIIEGSTAAQAERVLDNLAAVLAAAACTFTDVVKTTIFLTDLDDFQTVNEVYARFFANEPPARSTVQVAALPRGVRVEIEAIAIRHG
jgi:2-iminobutanoate/2-iminopropanoate deaminase